MDADLHRPRAADVRAGAESMFYGGLVRTKNMLSVLMQVFVGFSLITVLWCIYGYSLAFTEGNSFFGSLTERLFLRGTFDPVKGEFANAATFRDRKSVV